MVNIPIVFWLVLLTSGYGVSSSSVVPIPFSSADDCVNAGKAYINGDNFSKYITYRCLPQRLDDVKTFQGWAGQEDKQGYDR